MLHEIDTVIVGGGQTGLAISYYLTQEGREHVALERDLEKQRNGFWNLRKCLRIRVVPTVGV
jgi:cation diffusion facilitator CzcD-associated flavoprotein CzcO